LEFQSFNKFEKEKRVIELHKEGKTLKEIAQVAHMSFRDIPKIIKAYEKKIRLETKKEDKPSNQKSKKPHISSRAFKLFSDGKSSTEVVIELDIPPEKVEKLWSQFLKSERMGECYDFFQECQYDIPTLLSINNFMKRNNISGKNIANVLRQAKDVINLNQTYSNLKTEIEGLKQMKNKYSLNQNNNYQQLLPLGLPKYYYEYLL